MAYKAIKSGILNLPYGSVRVQTFRAFLKEVPHRTVMTDHHDTVGYYRFDPSFRYDAFQPPTPVTAYLDNSDRIVYNALKDLLREAEYKTCERASLEAIYNAATELACENGNPNRLVRLDRRTWSLLNPNDFMVYVNEAQDRSCLAMFKPRLLVAWEVAK